MSGGLPSGSSGPAAPAELTWPAVLTALVAGDQLSADHAAWAMNEVMSGEASPAHIAAFLMGLRAKGESVAEMRALADAMLEHAVRIEVAGPTLDVVGTGGDRAHTVNISTMAAVVAAAAGARVVKHGNRAASSSSGSADLLEALGVNLTLSPERVAAVAEEVGITFCFAQLFHPSFRYAAATRRDLGIATAFNFLGPLTNPSRPPYAAVGVADRRMAGLLAGVFAARGTQAAVFRGDDGLDELTVSTTSSVWWVSGARVGEHTLDPTALGIERAPVEALRGADAAYNAQVAREVFAGRTGPVRDAVVLNAGMALAVTDADGPSVVRPADLLAKVAAGMERAATALDSRAAERLVAEWVRASNA